MIQVRMTTDEFEQRAAELHERYGIALTDPVGQVTKDGVTAGYTHYNDVLTVHIVDKPFFISTEYCEQQLQEWLAGRDSVPVA